jgi:hypothetical protein
MPALSGHDGGHDTNLRQYAADGMALAGRLTGADGEVLTFADDLAPNLEHADGFFDERFRPIVDAYIERAGIDAPPDARADVSYEPEGLTELNLRDTGISTIVWATGYDLDFSWIAAPSSTTGAIRAPGAGSRQCPASSSWACSGSTPRPRPRSSAPRSTPLTSSTRSRSPGRRAHPGEDRVVGIHPARDRA